MSGALVGVVTHGAQLGIGSILVRPKRSFGPFTAYVLFEEQHTDELQITEHPIEVGGVVSDHAFKRPPKLVIKCMWTNSPSTSSLLDGVVGGLRSTVTGVQAILSGNSENKVREIYDRLLKLQQSVVPFDVFTGKRQYVNMLVESLSVRTDRESENSLMVTANFQQLLFVSTQTFIVTAEAAKQLNAPATMPTAQTGVKPLIPAPNFKLPPLIPGVNTTDMIGVP